VRAVNTALTTINKAEQRSYKLLQRTEYGLALAIIQALESPNGYDLHNAGICLWGLGNLSEALTWMYRAKNTGLEVASVDIAAIQHLQGNNDLALNTLESVDEAKLRPTEYVRALYTHAEILRLNQNLSQSITRLHEAWVACETFDYSEGREPIATSMALALHSQGDEAAEKWLDIAVRYANPMRRDYLGLQKAILASYHGQHALGFEILQEIAIDGATPFIQTLYYYLKGLVLIDSDSQKALEALHTAASVAAKSGLREFEIVARLRTSALELKGGQTASARAQLARIERLPMSRVNASEWKMRRGNIANAEGHIDLAKQLTLEARNELKSLEHHREYAWAQLSLARVEADHGQNASQRLDELADTCQFIGLKLLSSELSLTPNLEQLASHCSEYALQSLGLTRKAQRYTTKRYYLKLFGNAELRADGRAVSLRSNRMLDLIAYLHTHQDAKFDEVINAIFASTADRQSAQNHFAQLRHLVAKQLPGLHIEPNKRLKTYRLHSEIIFESDFERVERLLGNEDEHSLREALDLRGGPLMVNVEGEWASDMRHQSDHKYSKAGFRAMARLYDEGHKKDALGLGERLLEVNPLDRMVAAYTVEIVGELHGQWAARQQLESYIAHYREQGLPPPENLLALCKNYSAVN